MLWRAGNGAWWRRQRRAPTFTVATDREMQRVVLTLTLRDFPELRTFPGLADELFENPSDFVAGYALARAVRDLVLVGLLYSNGLLTWIRHFHLSGSANLDPALSPQRV